jgi:hypothetical protein
MAGHQEVANDLDHRSEHPVVTISPIGVGPCCVSPGAPHSGTLGRRAR